MKQVKTSESTGLLGLALYTPSHVAQCCPTLARTLERFDIRLPASTKNMLAKAAEINGSTLTALVLGAAMDEPACIQDAFRHRGFCEASTADVADEYRTVLLHQCSGEFVSVVLALVFDFGMNSLDALLLMGALGFAELHFKVAVTLLAFQHRAIATDCPTL